MWVDTATTGVNAGFNWKGDDANAAITSALKVAGRDSTTVTDARDQTFWAVLNGSVADGNYYYEFTNSAGVIFKDTETVSGGPKNGLAFYGSFLKVGQNANNRTVKNGDTINFKVRKVDATPVTTTPTAKPTGEATITVNTANDLTINATPTIVDGADNDTVKVEFNNKLMGDYVIRIAIGSVQTNVTPLTYIGNPALGAIAIKDGKTISSLNLTEGKYTAALYQKAAAGGTNIISRDNPIASTEFEVYRVVVDGADKYAVAGQEITLTPGIAPANKVADGWKLNGTVTEIADNKYVVNAKEATNYVINIETNMVSDYIKTATVQNVESATIDVVTDKTTSTLTIKGAIPDMAKGEEKTYTISYVKAGTQTPAT